MGFTSRSHRSIREQRGNEVRIPQRGRVDGIRRNDAPSATIDSSLSFLDLQKNQGALPYMGTRSKPRKKTTGKGGTVSSAPAGDRYLDLVRECPRQSLWGRRIHLLPQPIRPVPWCSSIARPYAEFSMTIREAHPIHPGCERPRLWRRSASRSNGTWTRKKGVRREATRPTGRLH